MGRGLFWSVALDKMVAFLVTLEVPLCCHVGDRLACVTMLVTGLHVLNHVDIACK
jgi:hypothetical protein